MTPYRPCETCLIDPQDRVRFFIDGKPESAELVLGDARRAGEPWAFLWQDGKLVEVSASVDWIVLHAEECWEQ